MVFLVLDRFYTPLLKIVWLPTGKGEGWFGCVHVCNVLVVFFSLDLSKLWVPVFYTTEQDMWRAHRHYFPTQAPGKERERERVHVCVSCFNTKPYLVLVV